MLHSYYGIIRIYIYINITHSSFRVRVKVVIGRGCAGQIAGARKVAHIKYPLGGDRAQISRIGCAGCAARVVGRFDGDKNDARQSISVFFFFVINTVLNAAEAAEGEKRKEKTYPNREFRPSPKMNERRSRGNAFRGLAGLLRKTTRRRRRRRTKRAQRASGSCSLTARREDGRRHRARARAGPPANAGATASARGSRDESRP